MITEETVRSALGEKYDPQKRVYVIAEKGPAYASKIATGWRDDGKLADEVSAGNTDLFVLSKEKQPVIKPLPKEKPVDKSEGLLKRIRKGRKK